MRRDEFLARLESAGLRFFTTTDAALAGGIPKAHASVLLGRLARGGWVVPLIRGKWFFRMGKAHAPLALLAFLASPRLARATGPTALHHHGLLDQIPGEIHAAWRHPTRTYRTPLGTYRFHKLPPPPASKIHRIETREGPVAIASPTLALFETAYLAASPRSGVWLHPVLEAEGIDPKGLRGLLRGVRSRRYRDRVLRLLRSVMTIR